MTDVLHFGGIVAHVRGIIEEELGAFRPLADLSATEIEAMAAKLTRALEPVLASLPDTEAQRSAA